MLLGVKVIVYRAKFIAKLPNAKIVSKFKKKTSKISKYLQKTACFFEKTKKEFQNKKSKCQFCVIEDHHFKRL